MSAITSRSDAGMSCTQLRGPGDAAVERGIHAAFMSPSRAFYGAMSGRLPSSDELDTLAGYTEHRGR